jgi:hypothetical protein
LISTLAGLRTNAVTVWPCSRAWATSWRPMLPVDPKMSSFLFGLAL